MSEKKEKNYLVSSIKAVTTQYGQLFNCAMKKEDLDAIEKNGWVSFTIAERREPSEKGVTHYAFENTYEPKQKDNEKVDVSKAKEDDLPF
jgi:hypothetical protein|tara:strand:- start:477 stop:746 length:270 start_codon:yes stop_codon:yes gene_type:complete